MQPVQKDERLNSSRKFILSRGRGTRHASFALQRDSLQRFKSLDRKSISFRHHSFKAPMGHRPSSDGSAPQGNPKAALSITCVAWSSRRSPSPPYISSCQELQAWISSLLVGHVDILKRLVSQQACYSRPAEESTQPLRHRSAG